MSRQTPASHHFAFGPRGSTVSGRHCGSTTTAMSPTLPWTAPPLMLHPDSFTVCCIQLARRAEQSRSEPPPAERIRHSVVIGVLGLFNMVSPQRIHAHSAAAGVAKASRQRKDRKIVVIPRRGSFPVRAAPGAPGSPVDDGLYWPPTRDMPTRVDNCHHHLPKLAGSLPASAASGPPSTGGYRLLDTSLRSLQPC